MATLTYGSVVGSGPGWTSVSTPGGVRTVRGDRAMRNNNPGNIRASDYANNAGAIGQDGGIGAVNGHFAVFPDRQTGINAQAGLIFGGRTYRNLTLRQAIAKYAPATENNTAAYAAAVAAAAGVSLDTKMKDIPADRRAAVLSGMQAVEGNTSAKVYDANGNLTDTIDAVSPATPNTAPTPYGPNSSQALGALRPDNNVFGGPKGLFSVDTSVASPIGHVSRSPLGPVAPAAAFSGLGTPRGVNVAPSRPSISSPGSFTSQDEKSNTGSYTNAPNPGNFTSQDERSSFSERMGIPGAVAPSISSAPPSAPAPARPDNANYAGPKGIFSVDPGAVVKGISPTPTAPAIGPTAPAAPVSAAPAPVSVAPVAAVARPAVQVAQPSVSRQSLAPARPALSAADVYGGTIGTAQTSTPGTTVSRATSYGPTYTTNQYGAVTATAPDGTQMAAWGGVPSRPAISGPLNQTGISTQAPTGGLFGPKAKSATGAVAGAALGGYTLGPLGAIVGGIVGKNLAQGRAPFAGFFGGANNANTHVVDTFDGPMRAMNAVGGLGFPSAPSGPAPGGVASGMRGLSPGAANAIDHGYAGLY